MALYVIWAVHAPFAVCGSCATGGFLPKRPSVRQRHWETIRIEIRFVRPQGEFPPLAAGMVGEGEVMLQLIQGDSGILTLTLRKVEVGTYTIVVTQLRDVACAAFA